MPEVKRVKRAAGIALLAAIPLSCGSFMANTTTGEPGRGGGVTPFRMQHPGTAVEMGSPYPGSPADWNIGNGVPGSGQKAAKEREKAGKSPWNPHAC